MDDIQVMVCDDSALMRNLIGRIVDETTGMSAEKQKTDRTLLINLRLQNRM